MERAHHENPLKEAEGLMKEALEKQPFVIVVKTDMEQFGLAPHIEVTLMTEKSTDAVVLAARVINLVKEVVQHDPIVELMPFLEVDDDPIRNCKHIEYCPNREKDAL